MYMYTCYSRLPMKKVSFYARNFSGNSAILSSDKYILYYDSFVDASSFDASSALNANYNSLMSQKETLKSLWKREESNLYKKKVMAENPVIIENVIFDCKRWVSYIVRHFPPKWLKWGTQSYTYFFNYRSPPKHKKSFFILPWIMEHIS